MAEVEVDASRLRAGADYLHALRALGLEPEGLFWAHDRADGDKPVLILVTRYFDVAGPLALSNLLFKAYNAAATPREIDPFTVYTHSPDHFMIRKAFLAIEAFEKEVISKGKGAFTPQSEFDTGTLRIPLAQAYIWNGASRSKADLRRRWGVISDKVAALAA